jgi:hypothetical protein
VTVSSHQTSKATTTPQKANPTLTFKPPAPFVLVNVELVEPALLEEVLFPPPVPVGTENWLEVVLVTVAGIPEPLVIGNTLKVVQGVPDTFGHTSVRFKPLSKGPVGPVSYFQAMLAFRKFTCLGSLSRYCSSPHLPSK